MNGMFNVFLVEETPLVLSLVFIGALGAFLNEVAPSISLVLNGVLEAFIPVSKMVLNMAGSIQQTLVDLSALAGKIRLELGGVIRVLLVAPKILNLKTLMYIVAFFSFLTYYARTLEDLLRSGDFRYITVFFVRVALAPLVLMLVLSIIGSIPNIRIMVSENGLEVSIG